MDETEKTLFELGKKLEDKKETFPDVIRDGAERWKLYMDNLADVLLSWHHNKSVWATALKFIALKYGNEIEIELPEDYKNVPFLVNIDVYPKEGNTNIWTLKIMILEDEAKDE